MGRRIRQVAAGAAMHVWQRGNHQQTVFGNDAEHRMFLGILLRNCEWYDARLTAFCLMTNHYHLVIVGEQKDSVSRAVGCTSQEYSVFKHRLAGTKGQLWERRFGSKILDEAHFWSALCYVERNPVEAGLVEKAWDWEWSSARVRLGMATEERLDLRRWRQRYDAESWKRALEIGIFDAAMAERAMFGNFRNQWKNPVARHPEKSGEEEKSGSQAPGEILVAEGGGWVDSACA